MRAQAFELRANIVDIVRRRVFPGVVAVENGRIRSVVEEPGPICAHCETTLMPGFVDAHIHVESSMLTPCQFARAAVVHGTVATVSDPHEIANVLGVEGVRFMLDDAANTPLKILFGAPACVPATAFETAGATLDVAAVTALLDDPRIGYLSEMMDFPGVLRGDRDVLAKIDAARSRNKPVDGHAPGLRGGRAAEYIRAGISTDHECFTKDEALDKLAAGAIIQVREGSAARNFEALYTLIDEFPGRVMLCSDDKHPDELMTGHINELARRAVARGIDPMNVIRAACANPVHHYRLNVGLLQEGDPADFIEVDSLTNFNVLRTFIDGVCVAERGRSLLPEPAACAPLNRFEAGPIRAGDLKLPFASGRARVIGAMDGQLVTECRVLDVTTTAGYAVPDTERDILKIAVVNRHAPVKGVGESFLCAGGGTHSGFRPEARRDRVKRRARLTQHRRRRHERPRPRPRDQPRDRAPWRPEFC